MSETRLIDAHCHLQAEEFTADRPEVLARCAERGMLCVVGGNRHDDCQEAVALAESNPNLFAVVGLHPMYLSEEEWEPLRFERLVDQPRVVGIGEIGLDYYRLWADTPEEERMVKDQQAAAFRAQLIFARSHGKPVVVHCRDAYDDLLKIIQDYSDLSFMIHTFLGNEEQAKRFLDLGCFLSFSGILTFDDAEELRSTVKTIPLERMMIETDAPYLAPQSRRGQRNEPVFVEEVAKTLAEVKEVSVEEVIRVTGENATTFFGLPRE